MEFLSTACNENKILAVRVMKTKHSHTRLLCEQNRSLLFVPAFFPCEATKGPATDGINYKHENGLTLSITFLILYAAYIKKSQKFAIKVEFGQSGD